MIAYRYYCTIATGGCQRGGDMLAYPQERENYSKDFSSAQRSEKSAAEVECDRRAEY